MTLVGDWYYYNEAAATLFQDKGGSVLKYAVGEEEKQYHAVCEQQPCTSYETSQIELSCFFKNLN